MQKIINPWLHKEGYNCFGCAPENPIGLHMHFYEEGDKIVSFWQPQEQFQGWVGTLHGGIISTLIDETAGWAVSRKLQTKETQIHYFTVLKSKMSLKGLKSWCWPHSFWRF